jgi:hypothetical protein
VSGLASTGCASRAYQLAVYVEDVDNATGTVYSSSTSAPITVTVNNPPPTTSILIPSNNATISGTQVLDAAASSVGYEVEFYLTGGSLSAAVQLIANPTIYGWIAQLNTRTVPDGTYALQSLAYDLDGLTGTSSITVTV